MPALTHASGMQLLRQANVRNVFVAYLITYLGTAMAPIAMAFGVLELTGSTRDTAIVMAATTLSTIVVLFAGGVIADRFERKKVIVYSELLAMLIQLVISVLFLSGYASTWNLTLLMLLNGFALAFNGPATMGFIPELVSREQLQQTNALLGMARNGAMIGGAALGGILVSWVGAGFTILIDGLSFLVSAMIIWRLKPIRQFVAEKSHSVVNDLKLGWREFTAHTWLWVVVLQFAFVVAGNQALMVVIGPAIMHHHYGGSGDWGVLMSLFAAGLVVGGLIAFRMNARRPMRLAVFCVFFYSLLPLFMMVPANMLWLGLAAFIEGVAGEIFVVIWVSTLQQRIPQALLSRVSAYDYIGSICLAPFAVVLFGFLYEWLELRLVLALIAGLIIIPTVLALFVRDVWRLPAYLSTDNVS